MSVLGTITTAIAIGSMGADIGFRALSITCSKAVDGIGYFITNTHPSFAEWNKLLVATDIAVKLNKIDQLSKEFKEKEDAGYVFRKSIQLAIADVDGAINDITKVLATVREMHEYHTTKYASTWRSVDCSEPIDQLRLAFSLLQSRFEDLTKIISITSLIDGITSH